jgi:DNA invertase Pin-like site-specific DNA recombinase
MGVFMVMRVALYTRVSTDVDPDAPGLSAERRDEARKRKQDVENQERELRAFATSQGWTVVMVYTDRVSGAKGRDKRPGFDRMLTDAAKRQFDVVLVWAADRLTRQGPYAMLDAVRNLNATGVKFHSFQQPFLSTATGFGEVLLALFAWLAQEERALISARTKAGLARVKASGTKLGRKPIAVDMDVVRSMRDSGASIRAIAKATNVSIGHIHSLCSTKVSKSVPVSAAGSVAVFQGSGVQQTPGL